MRRLVTHYAGWGGLLFFAVGLAATTAAGATKAERARAAGEAVQEALRCEIGGTNEDRARLLESAMEHVPDYPPALWQTGHVEYQKKWVRYDAVPHLLADDRRLVEYRHRRERAANSLEGQLALAQWCLKRKLTDQARAHLTAVLEIDPDHAEARALLGYRQVDGVWLSEQEIQEAAVRAEQLADALSEWKPKLEEILQGLQDRGERQRRIAAERLRAIDDPAAISAIELVLSMHNQQTALSAIEVLDKLEGREAGLALARQAVFSPWGPVRRAAVEALGKREPVLYVPQLLAALSTPVQTRAELYRAPNGRLMYRHALYRERQEQGELVVFETEYRRTLLWSDAPDSYELRRSLLAAERQRDAAEKAQAIEMAVAERNAFIGRLNERICWVLSQATGEQLPINPEAWWRWWNDYNGVFIQGVKPVKEAYYRDTVEYADPYDELPIYTVSNDRGDIVVSYRGEEIMRRRRHRHSCLLAGTLVWTDSGTVPIEQVRVGDLALAQHPDTGELAYKPVLKTTRRPPVRMLKVVFGDLALQCDDGHPFWVPGEGWLKACELQEGMRLRAVEGTVKVRSVHPTGFEQLHNLVVADFHTYFVTEAKILTHDNTIREPTTALVPGLAPQSSRAQ